MRLYCSKNVLDDSDDLMAGNLQQATVHRVGNGFLLHRGVNDHTLKVLPPTEN